MTSIFLQELEEKSKTTTHNVKSWKQFFQLMLDGKKKHDMRNMKDREYKVGDILNLQEYDPFKGEYTGREAKFKITYITSSVTPCALSSAMLDDTACILSLELITD
jgi:isopenicillin N synthase-like dioxygenase